MVVAAKLKQNASSILRLASANLMIGHEYRWKMAARMFFTEDRGPLRVHAIVAARPGTGDDQFDEVLLRLQMICWAAAIVTNKWRQRRCNCLGNGHYISAD
jgi:hypothetical protein